MWQTFKQTFWSTRLDRIALTLIVIAIILRLALALLPLQTLAQYFVPDDSFYYFKIGQNVASGVGSTFDGEHITNGYHPLWLVITAGFMSVFSGDSAPVHGLLVLGALLDGITLFLVYAIARRLFGSSFVSVLLTALIAFNPVQISWAVNGLETSITGLLFVMLVYMPIRYGAGRWPAVRLILWGVLGGLLVLARADYGLFPLFLFLWFLWRNRSSFWRSALLIGIPSVLVVLPWVLWSYFAVGTPVQESGLALTYTNRELFLYKPRTVLTLIIWSCYQFLLALHMTFIQTGLWFFVYVPLAYVIVRFLRMRQYVARVRASWSTGNYQIAWMLALASIAFVFVHGALRWTPRDWYFIGPAMLLVFLLIPPIVRVLRGWGKIALVIVVLGCFMGVAIEMFPRHPAQKDMIQAAYWMRENLPRDARIAAFNSGIYGYLSERYVLNSDGLVSHETLQALRAKRLYEFFQETKITHFADYDIALSYRYRPFLGVPDIEKHLKEIAELSAEDGGYHGSQLHVYELNYAPKPQ